MRIAAYTTPALRHLLASYLVFYVEREADIDVWRVLRAARDTPAGADRGLIIGPARDGTSERERQIQPGAPFSHDRSFIPCFLPWPW